MATMHYLDQAGMKFLVENLMAKIDESFLLKLNARIVTAVGDTSTDNQIPSAKSVYSAIQEILSNQTGVDFEVVDSLPTEGDKGVIYLVKSDPGDPTDNVYIQYIYVGDQWITLGDSDIDLSGYWSKTELQALTNAEITGILDEVFP